MAIRFDQEKQFTQNLSVYVEDTENDTIKEIAGMLRGLMCAIEGYSAMSGKTNLHFQENYPVKLEFSSVENANYFKECVEFYFSENVLQQYLRVKRRVRR